MQQTNMTAARSELTAVTALHVHQRTKQIKAVKNRRSAMTFGV